MKKIELNISGKTVCGDWNEKVYSSKEAGKVRIYVSNTEHHIIKNDFVKYLNNEKLKETEAKYSIAKDELHEQILNSTNENYRELAEKSEEIAKEKGENRLIEYYEDEKKISISYFVYDVRVKDHHFVSLTLLKQSDPSSRDDDRIYDAFKKYSIQ